MITEMPKQAGKQRRESCSKMGRREVNAKLKDLPPSFLKAYNVLLKEQLGLVQALKLSVVVRKRISGFGT